MKLLFVCSFGRDRSPTAAAIYQEIGYDVRYGGVKPKAFQALTKEDLEWAEVVLVFSSAVLVQLGELCGGFVKGKHIINLDIPNRYLFGAPALQHRIIQAMRKWLPELDHPEPGFTMVMRQRP